MLNAALPLALVLPHAENCARSLLLLVVPVTSNPGVVALVAPKKALPPAEAPAERADGPNFAASIPGAKEENPPLLPPPPPLLPKPVEVAAPHAGAAQLLPPTAPPLLLPSRAFPQLGANRCAGAGSSPAAGPATVESGASSVVEASTLVACRLVAPPAGESCPSSMLLAVLVRRVRFVAGTWPEASTALSLSSVGNRSLKEVGVAAAAIISESLTGDGAGDGAGTRGDSSDMMKVVAKLCRKYVGLL